MVAQTAVWWQLQARHSGPLPTAAAGPPQPTAVQPLHWLVNRCALTIPAVCLATVLQRVLALAAAAAEEERAAAGVDAAASVLLPGLACC